MRHVQKTYENLFQRQLAYEIRPYFCLFLGAVGIAHSRMHGSMVTLSCGVVLIACGMTIINWRAQHRGR